MILRKTERKIKFEPLKIHDSHVVFPRCENAVRACRLAKKNHLDQDEVKLLEMMGFEIELVARGK